MTVDENERRNHESKIRSEISAVIAINPVDLNMSLRKRDEVHRRRQEIIRQLFTDSDDIKCANKLLKGYETEEEIHRRENELVNTPGEELWLPAQQENVLSGFLPIPPMKARGGTSEVWICKSRFADRTVVVKLITTQGTEANLRPALALRELQTLFNLRHPNIVNVYDAGYLRTKDGDFPFVAMEEVPGVTLSEWVRQPTHISSAIHAASAAAVIANAIHFCHVSGVAHGDLKPDNILIDGEEPTKESIKLIDFGFAGSLADSPLATTVGYSAPQTSGTQHLSMTFRDIFSIGAILYFLCSGRHPYPAFGLSKDRWEAWYNGIDLQNSDLTLICKKCLAFDETDRYSSALQIEEDLNAWLTDHPLPHVRRNDYSSREKKALLFKRSRELNHVSDHMQVVARASLFFCLGPVALGIGHALQVAAGVDPETAFYRANTPVSVFCLALLLRYAYAINFNLGSMKIIEPVLALIVAFMVIIHFICPANWGGIPTWQELNRGNLTAVLLLAVLWISYSSLSPEWRMLRPLGWFTLVLAIFLRPIYESQYSPVAMPIVTTSLEVVACLTFAQGLWNSKARTSE